MSTVRSRKTPDLTGPQQIARIPFRPGDRVQVRPLAYGPFPNGREGVVRQVVGAMTGRGVRPPIIWRVWLEGAADWVEADRCELVPKVTLASTGTCDFCQEPCLLAEAQVDEWDRIACAECAGPVAPADEPDRTEFQGYGGLL